MTADEKAKFVHALKKMQRKGLLAVVLCLLVGAGIAVGFQLDPGARKANPIAIYAIAGAFLAAGVWAFNNNFVKLPARVRRLMMALETPGQVLSTRVWVVAANEAVAKTPVAQWCLDVELRNETITLVPGVRAQAEELEAIVLRARQDVANRAGLGAGPDAAKA